MPDLRTLQSAFAGVLAAPTLPAVPDGVFAGARPALADRLALYRGNVAANARKALAAAYPIIGKLVGEAFFDGLAREFARHAPSKAGDLNVFGEGFAGFLATFPPARELPYLPDVARLEWAIHRAYYAADAEPLDPARLAQVPPEAQGSLRLRLHPACALLASPWPLARIWEVHRDDHEGDVAVAFEPKTHYCLVHRPAWRVMVGSLEAGPHLFLESVLAGHGLEEAVIRALAVDATFDLGHALATWIDAAVIVDIVTGD